MAGDEPVTLQNWLILLSFVPLLLSVFVPKAMEGWACFSVLVVAPLLVVLGVRWCYRDRRGERLHRGECPHCGYSLTGNLSGVCPECGTRVVGAPEPYR